MGLEVRQLRPEELSAWVANMHLVFHSSQAPDEEVAYRRDVRGMDYERSLAALDGPRVVGTYESFTAELTLPGGGCVPTDGISSVTVLPSYHRRGLLRRMITADLEAAKERGEVAAILLPAEYPIYGRFGFGQATETVTYTLSTHAARFTQAAPGQVDLVEPAKMADVAPPLFERFRRVYPGQIDRQAISWELRLGLRPFPWRPPGPTIRCALYTSPTGEPEGYVLYSVTNESHRHVPGSILEVRELIHLTPEAYLGLWRYCAEVDLIAQVKAGTRRTEEPIAWLLDNSRAALEQTERYDLLWLRPMDVERLLSARRYASPQQLVLEVADPLEISSGRFALEGGPDGATCQRTTASADITLSSTSLGAISLGGVSARMLADARLIEENTPGAVDKADALFRWPVPPWCSTFF